MGTDEQSAPLSATQLLGVRAAVSDADTEQIHVSWVRRLLATLDAARERPSALDVETLRADIQAELDALPSKGWHEGDPWNDGASAAYHFVLARLTEPDAGEGTEPWGDMTPAQRYAAWHDPDVCRRDAHGCMCSCHEGFTPDTTEATLDHIAWAQAIRLKHEATHGEAEQCGAECIALGLAEFDYEYPA